MAEVRLQNVVKQYDNGHIATRNVSFDIHDQEFMVLVGPSGCGKSTLLRMIAGLETITSGEIFIGNKLVNEVAPKDRDIAMVFQNYALYPHMNVFENMAFGLRMRKTPKHEIETRVNKAAEILGISGNLLSKPKELSGGQRQRVAVGRAIVRQPSVFLFDEPLSNLDAKLRVLMRAEIAQLHHQLKTTMIYVTHDQTEAMTLGQRIVVLKDGIIQQIDTPIQLYNEPCNKFVAGFIGSPAMNFIEGKYQDKTFRSDAFNLQLPAFFDGIISIGIRPENIHYFKTPPTGQKFFPISGVVNVIEQMGNELFVYLKNMNQDIIARIQPDADLKIGSEQVFWIDSEKVLFFDKQEKRLK